MAESHLIELLKDFKRSHTNKRKRDALLEQCLNASTSDLEELSQLLSNSPDTYLPILQTFISHLCNNPRATHKQNTLFDFTLLIITIVITKNIHHSDIPDFVELLHNCIELLWSAGNKDINKLNMIMKNFFSIILDADGVIGVLVSSKFGRHCLKRILLDFKMIKRIEQEELLRAVDVIAALMEKCSEHKEISYDLSKSLSEYKACITLLEVLRSHHNKFWNWNLAPLSVENEQHLTLLNMVMPQRKSDFPHFLHALDQRKINLFQYLMEYSPCTSCHKQIFNYFSPEKYFLKEESVTSLRLPFEFNDDDKLGPWDVLLSEDTIESLQQLELYVVKAVMKKLGHISSGEWGKYKLQRVVVWDKHELQHTVQTHAIPVYEVELPDSGLRILWSVDYGFSIRNHSLTQLVKVWAITTDQEKIHKILKNLSVVHQVYTAKHIDHCTYIQTDKDNSKVLPKFFLDKEETKSSDEDKLHLCIDDVRLLEIHKMFVTNKFVPLSKNLFKSLVLGGLKFTFQISKEEYNIISSPTSAIIIGRSGTGKTTCIVFRQITSYLNSRLGKTSSYHKYFHKKQIFITVSPHLRDKVKEYFYKVKESAMLAGQKMSMKEYYEYKRIKQEDIVTNNIMPEEDDEKQVISFHQLEDHDFPLFITYDEFSEMLQKTYGINNRDLSVQQKSNASNVDSGEGNRGSSFINISSKNFVDYKVFQKKYWPRLNDFCKQKFNCELVYSEFSIIKGSDPEVGYLSREDYRNISIKKYPVFRYYRDHIYDLFQKYEKMKAWNGHYDSIDRTLAILRRAKTKALGGPHIHEVYIDECQDNQIVDLSLILKVFNRTDAIFFAGDIAQCIARGSSFRFEDLNTLLYQWECTRAQTNYYQHNIIKPKQFELNINYRSHNEILKLASKVIGLIWHFFPNSIDKLSHEHGEVGGPQPIIFDEFKDEYFKKFSKSNNTEKNIEFGAEQVIIVRDEDSKLRVKKLIGKAVMVLTVFQAKGMEFDGVLLYNFFKNSPAEWRVILSALDEKSEGAYHEKQHYILLSELKHLYVAITRARQHIWICEENSDSIKPIQIYWKHFGLIRLSQNINEIVSNQSSSYEWNQKGKDYFKQQQYEQAIFCFEKSGNEDSYNLANAYYLWQIARDSINDSDDNTIKFNFIRAAQAFKDCFHLKQAALCYQDISMFEEAGNTYAKINMIESAARCYLKAKNWYKAGDYFEKAKKYTDAISAYKDGNLYKDLINFIQRCRKEIGEVVFRQNVDYVKVHYYDFE